jgi:hypothetical protein
VLTVPSVLLIVLSLVFSSGGQPRIVGRVPPAFNGIARAAWVAADSDTSDVTCGLVAAEWSCDNVSGGAHGVVVLVGDGVVSAVAVGLPPVDPGPTRWGRIVRITAGAVSPDDLHDLAMAAIRPERSRVRPQTRRFAAVQDSDVHVWKLTDTTFWVAGGETDPNAFLSLTGPDVGTERVAVQHLREGPADEPFYLSATQPASLSGRVHDARGVAADGAEIELWELLQVDDRPPRLDDGVSLIRRATLGASTDGAFRFDRVAGGVMLLTAWHPMLGSGRLWITEPSLPVDFELAPPMRATGRVVRSSLPVAGALLRFLPDADAFVTSTDPMDYLSREVRAGDDGTFSLPLPSKHAGSVLVALDDGARARVVVPGGRTNGDIVLGDIVVSDGVHLTVRLLDGSGCGVVAVGPLGSLGLAQMRAQSVTEVFDFDLPEAGAWSLNAECADHAYGLDPPIVVVPPDGRPTSVDARVGKSPG